MPRLQIPLPTSFYKTLGLNVSAQELVNLYRINSQESQKVSSYLIGTSGLEDFADLDNNEPVWGMKAFGGLLYVSCGNSVYSVNAAGTKNLIGNIGSVNANVEWDTNGINLVVLKPTGDAWEVTSSNVTQITDVDYLPSSSISQSYGYFIFSIKDSNEWQISDQDSIAFSGFIAQADASPDLIVRTIQNSGETWIYGTETIEVWAYNANIDFPYQRSTVINRGCAAKNSVISEDDKMYWLGDDKKIYVSVGYQYTPLSTEPIEQLIAGFNTISDAIFWVYTDGGQKFLTCQFPSENITLECNLTLGEWHKRTSGFNGDRWKANCFENTFGFNLVGDYQTGKIYKIVFDSTSESGENIYRSFTTPYFFDLDNPFSFDRIELDIEAGLGNTNNPGKNPQVYLSWSDDYGHTFSNQYPASVGGQGNYRYKAMWIGKGTARKRCLKFIINDPIKVRISTIFANVQKLQA